MVELGTVLSFIQAFGIIVGVAYYIMNIRISQRNQELSLKALEQSAKAQELSLKTQQQNLETRQAQLFMQIFLVNQSKELAEPWTKLISMDLSNPKELAERGWVKGEPKMMELMQLCAVIGTHYDGIGLYVRKGFIDIDMVKELLMGDYIMMWEKLKPLMYEIRKVSPFSVDNFEWLYERLKSMQTNPSSTG